jgi:hypothetical protein
MTDTQANAPPKRATLRQLVSQVKTSADRIRKKHEVTVDDPLTAEIVRELEWVLNAKTPELAIKRDEGPYPTVHLVWQMRAMDVLFGRDHWCWRIHMIDDRTARAHVVVGNHLRRITLDRKTGELVIPEEAQILRGPWELEAGVSTYEHRGAMIKGARTGALRAVLQIIGFGGDVTLLPRLNPPEHDDAHPRPELVAVPDPAPAVEAPPAAPARAPAAAQPAATEAPRPVREPLDPAEREAVHLLIREVRGLADEKRIPASQLAILIGRAVGCEQQLLDEQTAETRVLVMLESPSVNLTREEVMTLRALVEQADPNLPLARPTSRHHDTPAATEQTGGPAADAA